MAVPSTDRFSLDYGGWYSFHLLIFDDGVNSSRTYRRNDLRVWSRLTLDGGAHEVFARVRLSFLDFSRHQPWTALSRQDSGSSTQ